VPASEAKEASTDILSSVYHPDRESPEAVRASLRRLFLSAAADPLGQRRSLRFALRRLAQEHDPIAIEHTFAVLTEQPWEAPRYLTYVGEFLDDEAVVTGVNASLTRALERADDWLVTRLAPLAARIKLDPVTVRLLSTYLDETDSVAAWGLVLRALSMQGHEVEVRREVTRRVLDSRSALAALADIHALSPVARSWAPEVAALLDKAPAPAPSFESIL
jgi:hypothetical protein